MKSKFTDAYLTQWERIREKDIEVLTMISSGKLVVDVVNGTVMREDGKPVCTTHNPAGYIKAFYIKGDKKKYIMFHRIIMLAKAGLPPMFYEVNHIDGDRSNNKGDNLEWASRSANTSGIARISKPNGVLSPDQLLQLKRLRAQGWTYGRLAAHFAISHSTAKKWAEDRIPGIRGKFYKLISPAGKVFEGRCLKEFCQLMNLNYDSIRDAFKKGRPYKGWRAA